MPEFRIVLQRLFLLLGRDVFVFPQPLAGMVALVHVVLARLRKSGRSGHRANREGQAGGKYRRQRRTPESRPYPLWNLVQHTLSPVAPSRRGKHTLAPRKTTYGFATTLLWTCKSSSTSKSLYKSWFLSSACKSPTAVPGSTTTGPAWGACPVSTSVTPATMASVRETANTGLRTQWNHPMCRFVVAISSRSFACMRTSKSGEGSGAFHSSSSAIVRRKFSSSLEHAAQLCRWALISAPPISEPASPDPAASSGISSRMSSQLKLLFITITSL